MADKRLHSNGFRCVPMPETQDVLPMKSGSRALLLLCILSLLGSTGCTTATLKRNLHRSGREIARGLSRAGHGIESSFETLGRQARSSDFLSDVFGTGPSHPASYGSRGNRSTPRASARPSASNPPAPSRVVSTEAEHPFATPVPGRSGYVKLPGREHFPDVDVRGIAPGTSIDVPDPEQPGGSIGFRVP